MAANGITDQIIHPNLLSSQSPDLKVDKPRAEGFEQLIASNKGKVNEEMARAFFLQVDNENHGTVGHNMGAHDGVLMAHNVLDILNSGKISQLLLATVDGDSLAATRLLNVMKDWLIENSETNLFGDYVKAELTEEKFIEIVKEKELVTD